jgi:hypothetical protein
MFSIASNIGSPIGIDSLISKSKLMIERTLAQYAKVLIDLDLVQT